MAKARKTRARSRTKAKTRSKRKSSARKASGRKTARKSKARKAPARKSATRRRRKPEGVVDTLVDVQKGFEDSAKMQQRVGTRWGSGEG